MKPAPIRPICLAVFTLAEELWHSWSCEAVRGKTAPEWVFNIERAVYAPGGRLIGESCDACDLERSPGLKASMVIAKPRMAHYLEISGQIYGIYLKYAAPEHIHVYSIDEVFIDATPYLRSLGMGPHAMARTIVREILTKTRHHRHFRHRLSTCIWPKSPWISSPSTCPPTRTACAWPN